MDLYERKKKEERERVGGGGACSPQSYTLPVLRKNFYTILSNT